MWRANLGDYKEKLKAYGKKNKYLGLPREKEDKHEELEAAPRLLS